MIRPRIVGIVFLAGLLSACDPLQFRALSVTPDPQELDRTVERVSAIAAGVAARNGMTPHPDSPYQGEEGWTCHIHRLFRMCLLPGAGEVQFLFTQNGFSFSSLARHVLEEITTELRAEFGPMAVRECRLVRRGDSEAASGGRLRHVCVPTSR